MTIGAESHDLVRHMRDPMNASSGDHCGADGPGTQLAP
jgi:hypothetical protein